MCQKVNPEQLSLPSLPKKSHAGGFETTPPCCFRGNPQKQPAGDSLTPGDTHFGCCLCLELDDGCDCVWDWVDWGVVLACSWYWGVVIGWLGVV